MASPNVARMFSMVLAAGLAACNCVSEVTLTPKIGSFDPKTGSVAGVEAPITIKFGQCPSPEQKAIALEVSHSLAAAFQDVVAGKLSVDAYNQLVKAAAESLSKVFLYTVAPPSTTAHGASGVAADAAWADVERVRDNLRKAGYGPH